MERKLAAENRELFAHHAPFCAPPHAAVPCKTRPYSSAHPMLPCRCGKQRTTESVLYLPPRYHGEGEYPQHSANPRRMPSCVVLPNLSLELTGLKSLSVFLLWNLPPLSESIESDGDHFIIITPSSTNLRILIRFRF